jgi:hypothetical protein
MIISDWSLLECGLTNLLVPVRASAFAVLCSTKKRGTAPSHREMTLAISFVESNLSVDSAAFRQTLLADITAMIGRCRDPLVLRKEDQTRFDHFL